MNTQASPLPRNAPRAPRRGFTLIEMLVVMTLIAMLLTLAVPRYFTALDNARIRVQQQNVATLRDAIDKFFADQGRYPDALEDLVTKRYLRQLPLDPVTETLNWEVIAPQDTTLGKVYDVRPATPATPSGLPATLQTSPAASTNVTAAVSVTGSN